MPVSLPAIVALAALGLTAAALACSLLGVLRGRVPRRTLPGALLMAAASLDMLTPGRMLAPVLWGAVLLVAALAMLAGRPAPEARGELGWHAGSTVVMAGMQLAMAGTASGAALEAAAASSTHEHGGPVLWALLVAATVALAVAAVRHVPRARRREGGLAPLRHPLMAVAMLAMLVAMPAW